MWLYWPTEYYSRKGFTLIRISIAPVVTCLTMGSILTVICASAIVPAAAQAAEPSSAMPDDRATVVKDNNAFAVELYAQLQEQPGNLFFFPESISMALAMTYAGARGETATEMANTLHFTLPPQRLHPAMGALLRDRNAAHESYLNAVLRYFNAPHSSYRLHVANTRWAQQDYPLLGEFLKLTGENYGAAGFNTADFKNATEAARLTHGSCQLRSSPYPWIGQWHGTGETQDIARRAPARNSIS